MKFNFDVAADRKNTQSMKWDVKKGELPMSLADTEFETAPCLIKAVCDRAKKGAFGYTLVDDEW